MIIEAEMISIPFTSDVICLRVETWFFSLEKCLKYFKRRFFCPFLVPSFCPLISKKKKKYFPKQTFQVLVDRFVSRWPRDNRFLIAFLSHPRKVNLLANQSCQPSSMSPISPPAAQVVTCTDAHLSGTDRIGSRRHTSHVTSRRVS